MLEKTVCSAVAASLIAAFVWFFAVPAVKANREYNRELVSNIQQTDTRHIIIYRTNGLIEKKFTGKFIVIFYGSNGEFNVYYLNKKGTYPKRLEPMSFFYGGYEIYENGQLISIYKSRYITAREYVDSDSSKSGPGWKVRPHIDFNGKFTTVPGLGF